MRVGIGYDVHRLVKERKLILGGVEIPWELGLLGHSDADVLLHAIMDALLGAAALGDIGKHFPDTDERYRGISSIELLKHVKGLLEEKGFIVGNIDATVIAQRPKLAPYIPQMAANIARTLGIEENRVNVKATTEEGLGFTGTGEGISSQAVCLLEEVYSDRTQSRLAAEYDPATGEYKSGDRCAGCGGCSRK
ncbi:MAG: 2-C-methyl-D-erythritol 2,4-cyclodiphosphate synthase [Lachnospiraceae bacterium]|nr:2-C-methyl-D-erythritol 2,4-cyclodiphosphate synthase [Lachnospiraceae bacterium]